MYSRPAVRGRGAAKFLLRRLETEARAVGANLLRHETGVYQLEALRFYEDAGRRFGKTSKATRRAMCGRLRVVKGVCHVAALVVAAMCSAFERGAQGRWP